MTMASGSSSTLHPVGGLQRGKACIACRRRKVRCDGARPTCGQCVRGNRFADCEYTDGQGRSRTHMLEQENARLQARVQELEHPEHTTPAIALHDPYSSFDVPQGYSVPFGFQPSHISAPSPGASSSSSAQSTWGDFSPGGWWVQEEPPIQIVLESLDKILPYVDELGLFLHIPRMRNRLVTASSRGIPIALQNAIILLCLHITNTKQSTFELTVLSRCLRQLAEIIPSCSASIRDLLDVLQTEVLLTYYLLRVGRTVEAKYHSGAAASLVLAFRLHSSSEGEQNTPADMQSVAFDIFGTTLPNLVDDIEQTEAIHAFWNVFTWDKSVSAVLGVPPSIDRSIRVSVPWPRKMREVDSFDQDIHLTSRGQEIGLQVDTVQQFLVDGQSEKGDFDSALAFHAKAAVLLDEVNNLVEQHISDSRFQETHSFRAQFASLDALIQHLQASIVSNPSLTTEASPSSSRLSLTPSLPHLAYPRSLCIQSLLSLATIRLHSPFRESYTLSNAKIVTAAVLIARALQCVNVNTLQYFDPVLIIWTKASFVIHAEITRLRAIKAWPTQFPVRGEGLMQALRTMLGVLRDIADHCPVLAVRTRLETVLTLLDSGTQ
ncbi:uncharacterized protein F5891DRAFT_587386 [Suillus fuscotomentosus]|uniref:Zn(2)-C6 fungal-type domain-containing protein n=1 Tax=Suillus fuscotomentosus TaxID=1912939 RepID=A0AAD4DYQ3_9AGAM|nr:uncharacterized protein F5891DRAFT_587386 [Suillus fuscotomentosus]KAG1896571.1 hypothetical protein F5891DRAFT_587386 [Suillus fuscotomentosus]